MGRRHRSGVAFSEQTIIPATTRAAPSPITTGAANAAFVRASKVFLAWPPSVGKLLKIYTDGGLGDEYARPGR